MTVHVAAALLRAGLGVWLCCAMLAGVVHAQANAVAAPAADPWASLGEPVFKSHNERLVSNTVSFAQDKSGFVWMGTKTGLVRWDGYKFKRYVADAATAGALPDSYVLCLHIDPAGRLWIGTGAGGLARYDATQDKFITDFVNRSAEHAGDVKGTVNALADDGAGGLWIGTGKGLDHLDAAGKITSVPIPALLTGGSASVSALQHDDDGTLWIGTRLGVWRRKPGDADFVPLALPVRAGVAAATRLFRDGGGRTWVGTAMHGAFVVPPGADVAVPVVERGPAPTLATQRVAAIIEAEPNQIWLGTEGGGVLMVDARTGATRRARHRADAPGSLPEDDAVALFRERSGLILVAGMRVLSQHDPRQRAVLSLLMENGGTSIKAVAAMPDGPVWMGMNNGGIQILDPATRVVRPLTRAGAAAEALAGSRVLEIVRGPDQQVWIGTRRGLFRSSVDGQHIERITIPGRDATAQVWVMASDGKTLWLGGPDGLWGLDLGGPVTDGMPGVLRHATTTLGDNRVTAIARGAGSALWVGTRTGLVRLDTVTGATTAMYTGAANSDLLPSGYISSLLLDQRGRLWVAVYGNGIGLLESGDVAGRHRFRRLGLKEGLPDIGVNKLLEDGTGRLWASTDDGLALINPVSLAVRTLQQSQGVHVLEHWTNSGAVTSTGELLFGGQTGLTVVRPAAYKDSHYSAPVVVSDMHVGDKALPVGPYNQLADAAPVLQAGQGNVWVEFAALDFSAPERNRYAFRLQGYDADWIKADAGYRRANYDKLPPGDYKLLLRGSNSDGAWSQPRVLALHVAALWYQTVWWKIFVGLCGVGLIVGLVQGRTAYLRRSQSKLQGLVAEQTAELRAIQKQLEQMAYADPLTSLPNRRLFNDELQSRVALAVRQGNPFALLLVDLDRFKEINDTIGHDAGDALLVEVAQRLCTAVRDADRVARLGGDEFAVLLSNVDGHDGIEIVCKRIVASLALPVPFKTHTLQVSASIGVALCPGHASSANDLYKAADVALYAAKRSGRNTWRWYAGAEADAGVTDTSAVAAGM